jgi:hypothetical protein
VSNAKEIDVVEFGEGGGEKGDIPWGTNQVLFSLLFISFLFLKKVIH